MILFWKLFNKKWSSWPMNRISASVIDDAVSCGSLSHISEVLQLTRSTANTAWPNTQLLIKDGGRSNGSTIYLLIYNMSRCDFNSLTKYLGLYSNTTYLGGNGKSITWRTQYHRYSWLWNAYSKQQWDPNGYIFSRITSFISTSGIMARHLELTTTGYIGQCLK